MSSEVGGASGVEYLAIGCLMGQVTGVRERKKIGDPSATPMSHIPEISLAEAVGVGCRLQSLTKAGKTTGHLGLC